MNANEIDIFLISYNILPGYAGYPYIRYILEKTTTELSYIKITDLYMKIGIEFNVSAHNVERSIRSLLRKSTLNNLANKKALAVLQLAYLNKYKGANHE